MKAKITILVLFLVIAFSCSTAQGASGDLFTGMGKKLTKGVVNVLTGWVELPMQTMKGYNSDKYENNKLLGGCVGFFKGISYTIGRTAWGALELAGFWTANPEDNVGMCIPLDAEYAWEEGKPYDYCDPNFTEATFKPVSRKFLRGVGNALFGFAEFPGQVAKGFQDKTPHIGIMKGLWFWYSREIYGVADVATAIFPTPQDNPGYAFDQEYSWDAFVDVIEK